MCDPVSDASRNLSELLSYSWLQADTGNRDKVLHFIESLLYRHTSDLDKQSLVLLV